MEVNDADQKCWFTAKVVDVNKDKVQVEFPAVKGSQPRRSWMSWNTVREVPPRGSFELKEV